jgi:5,10-methylenetetrahydrofolate reductase
LTLWQKRGVDCKGFFRELMAKRTQNFGVPIFTGVWPLLSGRQADFLHNEVPGIVVPEQVRIQMAGSEGDEGRARGLAIARQISRAALERFPGVYLITPFLRYSTTVELAAFARSL